MSGPQLQTAALRTRLSVFVCAESPAPDSSVFVQDNGWEWAPSGRKLGGNDRPQRICMPDNGLFAATPTTINRHLTEATPRRWV
jgi:hypothetical protein